MLTHAEGEGELPVDTKADITLSALVWALRIDVLAYLRYLCNSKAEVQTDLR